MTGLSFQDLAADSKFYAQEQTKVEPPKTDNHPYFLRSNASSSNKQGSEQNVDASRNPNRTR